MDGNPPDKIMVPNIAPNIQKEDPRLIKIAEQIRQKLINTGDPNVKPESLEFEAKIGSITLNQYARTERNEVAEIFRASQQNQSWSILPPVKYDEGLPMAYKF